MKLLLKSLLLAAVLVTSLAAADVPLPTADDIMKRVAANQDREQQDRASYVYQQHIRVIVRRTSGKLAREESSDLLIAPGPKGSSHKMQSVKGRYWKKGQYSDFTGEPIPDAGTLDGGLASSFRLGLTDDSSKDGMAKDLFPLTTAEQKDLRFDMVGEEIIAGRPAYRIKFGPSDQHEITWAGEALIDKEELQPVSVYTRLSRRLPFLVRSLLGTDVPGLGFNVQYRRVDKDVWFPVSFGTEFRLHAVFFINRTISVSMENKDFKKTAVDSSVQYSEATPAPSR